MTTNMEELQSVMNQSYMGVDLSTWAVISTTVALTAIYITKQLIVEKYGRVSKMLFCAKVSTVASKQNGLLCALIQELLAWGVGEGVVRIIFGLH